MELETAKAIAEAVLRRGHDLAVAPLTVVILDQGGHQVVLLREDGSAILRPHIAIAKAWGALGMGLSSREIAERAAARPEFFQAVATISGGRLAPAPGGVLIFDGSTVVGAVGVSGDTSDVDEACAIAAVIGCGLRPEPITPVALPGR